MMTTKNNRSRRRGGDDNDIGDLGQLTPLQEALLKEASRKISIVSNGRSETVRMDEIVTRKMLQMAANGGQHAISNAIYQINLAQRISQQRLDDEVAFGRQYKAHQQHRLNEAQKRGYDLDTVLPHPDDIVVEDDAGYEVIGPSDEMELLAIKKDCKKRDAAILQAALEERLGSLPAVPGTAPSKHPADAAAILVVQVLNGALPQRFQKSDLQIAMELIRYRGVTKRDLLARSHRTWAALGRPKPRGWRFPSFETFISAFERVVPAMVTLYPDVKKGNLSVEAIAIRLQRLIGAEPIG